MLHLSSYGRKDLNCLTNGRVVYLYIIYKFSHECDYHLPKIEYNVLAHLVRTEIKRMAP
jgi:hypothetical protein